MGKGKKLREQNGTEDEESQQSNGESDDDDPDFEVRDTIATNKKLTFADYDSETSTQSETESHSDTNSNAEGRDEDKGGNPNGNNNNRESGEQLNEDNSQPEKRRSRYSGSYKEASQRSFLAGGGGPVAGYHRSRRGSLDDSEDNCDSPVVRSRRHLARSVKKQDSHIDEALGDEEEDDEINVHDVEVRYFPSYFSQ